MTNVPSEYLSIKILGDSKNIQDQEYSIEPSQDNYNLKLEIFTSNMIKLFMNFKFRWDYQYTKYIRALVNLALNQEFLAISMISLSRYNNSGIKTLEEYIEVNKLSINNMLKTVYGSLPDNLNNIYIALYNYIKLLQSIDLNEGVMGEDESGVFEDYDDGEDF